MRILIVEDNDEYGRLVAAGLARAGFETDRVTSGAAARRSLASVGYSAVVLDLGLPDEDGAALLDGMRDATSGPPVIVTTARNSLSDKVHALKGGAADYLVKPFALEELVARLQAVMRRREPMEDCVIEVGNLALDIESRMLRAGSRVQSLAAREVEVLEDLMRHAGHVVRRGDLAVRIFGRHGHQDAGALDVYVARLRRAFVALKARPRIDTIHGLGFLLSEGSAIPAADDAATGTIPSLVAADRQVRGGRS